MVSLRRQKVVDQFANSDRSEGLLQATLGTIDTKKGRKVTDEINKYLNNFDTNFVVMDFGEFKTLSKEDKEKS